MEGQTITKVCSICKLALPLHSFTKQKSSPDGLRYQCRECANAKMAEWRVANRDRLLGYYRTYHQNETDEQRQKRYAKQREVYHKDPVAFRNGYLLRTYGISQIQYDEMLRAQGGRCSICGSDDPCADRRFFAVDHDHKCCPGKRSCGKCIRGLLCMNCNQGLGKFQDDVNLMARAIAYLTEEYEMKTTVNKDGTVTTTNDDEYAPVEQPRESKVVSADKPEPVKASSKAESK